MSPLQLGLIVGGILLVVGVLVYNWWQERRVRRRIVATFSGAKAAAAKAPEAPAGGRVGCCRRGTRDPDRIGGSNAAHRARHGVRGAGGRPRRFGRRGVDDAAGQLEA